MNWLQFFASIISSLAWPVAVVILVFLLRKPLTQILIALTRVKNLKFKDFELDFGTELQDIKRTVANAAPIEQAEQTSKEERDSTSAQTGPSSEQQLVTNTYITEAIQLTSSGFSEAAVLVAWKAVEEALMNAALRLDLTHSGRAAISPGRNIDLLRAEGYIHTSTAEVLNRMRKLRNTAAHSSSEQGKVSGDDAIEFTDLASTLTETLNGLKNHGLATKKPAQEFR